MKHVVLATLVSVSLPPVLLGQGPSLPQEVRVVIATSGGISLGSYQAGVNWGLVELLRRTQVDDSLRQMILASATALPKVVGFSGASAGTINSLMSAIHYCTDGDAIPPEESLYWKTWVDVGWRQLMPNGSMVRPQELGLIDRKYFETVLLARLRAGLGHRGRPGCELQVAGSLTRQRAITEEVFDHVSISVQRHVGTYRIVVDTTGVMELRQASRQLRADRGLGVQISPAPDGATDRLAIEQVFELARASSSIPFVFAPIALDYYRSNELDSAGVCPAARERRVGCATPSKARFVDGGAFDNRPISIADRLLLASQVTHPPAIRTFFHTIFIVPSALRVGEVVKADTTSERTGGTLAATQFLASMWRSAAEYELHAYARSRSVDAERKMAIADTVEVTSRAFPIFGETLAHFGAFLARPFREHDFYVGVYDALNFSADRLCSGATSPTARSTTELRAHCHAATFHRLMHRVDVGCTGHVMVEKFYEHEHHLSVATAGALEASCTGSDDERRRNAMLVMIADAFRETQAAPRRCKRSYNPFETLMCTSGISAFATLVRSRGLDDSARVWIANKGQCEKAYAPVDSASAACFADEYFGRFVENPHDFIKRLAFLGLERAATVERVAQKTEGVNYADARLGLANPILRSLLGTPTTSGFEWDQSTVPRECPNGNLYPRLGACGVTQTILRLAAPYYVAGGFGNTMLETGVRPALHSDAETSIVFPLALHYGRMATTRLSPGDPLPRRPWLSAGVGVMWRNRTLALNECLMAMSWRGRAPWARSVIIPGNERALYRMQCDLFASRFTLGVTTTRLSTNDMSRWSLIVGLADFNGLLYWLLPQELRSK
ncbi:MAG: patatin-like phospholipase family protein [Gemmatimonadaceae bacterium]